jgi:hypothetical protein
MDLKPNSDSAEKQIKVEFYVFFKNIQTIFEMYDISYHQILDKDFLNNEERKSKIYTKLFEILKKKKHSKAEKDLIKFYDDEIRIHHLDNEKGDNWKKAEFLGKQTIISLINNFELFRKKLIKVAFKNFDHAQDIYIKTFNNCAINHHKITGDKRYNIVRESDMIHSKNLKLIEDHKKFSTVEKLMYQIESDEKSTKIYNKSYKVYIIYRELRNMLTHRENKTDDIFYDSLKSSIPSKIFQPEKDFSKFFKTLLGSNIEYNENGKSFHFSPFRISVLFSELLNLSFLYCISLTKKNIFQNEIADIYNDMLVDYIDNKSKNSYANFFLGNNFDLFTDLGKTDDLVFLVNSILVYDMISNHFGEKYIKYHENKIETYLERLKNIDKDKLHYNIIKAFMNKSSEGLSSLTKSTDEFLKKNEKEKSSIRTWYIFKKLKNEFYIEKYLNSLNS